MTNSQEFAKTIGQSTGVALINRLTVDTSFATLCKRNNTKRTQRESTKWPNGTSQWGLQSSQSVYEHDQAFSRHSKCPPPSRQPKDESRMEG